MPEIGIMNNKIRKGEGAIVIQGSVDGEIEKIVPFFSTQFFSRLREPRRLNSKRPVSLQP